MSGTSEPPDGGLSGNRAIARILRREGTELLFCFPSNALIDACAAEGIRPVLTRTERTLVNMADGYTRVQNGERFGVCAVQHGPGAENAFGGVAQAASDSVPLLFFAGGPDRRRRAVPYTFPAVEAYRTVAAWADEINLPERIPEMLRRAFGALRQGRRGPVVLEVPGDVGQASLPDAAVDAYRPPRVHRSMAAPEDVGAAADLLLGASRPVIYAGQGILWSGASEALRRLAERLPAPVLTTTNGKSAFDERHPLALGAAGYTGTAAAAAFLERADVVFIAGSSATRHNFTQPVPPGKRVVHLTADARDLYKDHDPDAGLVGDARLVLEQLLAELDARGPAPGAAPGGPVDPVDAVEEIARIKARWLEGWRPRLEADETPLSPYRVIGELLRWIDPAGAIVTHDSGNPRDQLLPFYEAVRPRGYLGWGKSTQLGYGYGLAMGAKLAAPEKLVVNVMGDAAFGMVGMDVETASRERIGVLTVVLNNGALGGYEKALPVATARYGTKFLSGRYAEVAAGLGAYAQRVEEAADLAPALDRARAATEERRPAVLEVITREEPEFSKYW